MKVEQRFRLDEVSVRRRNDLLRQLGIDPHRAQSVTVHFKADNTVSLTWEPAPIGPGALAPEFLAVLSDQ